VLFALVFFWTPAHFWALALKYRDDYAAAGIPMLPVVAGVEATARQIAVYAVITVVTSFVLEAVADVGALYAIVASIVGAVFVLAALRLVRAPTPPRAMGFFALSNLYLTILFAALALDVVASA
jgi:protoheme IX farnesyltransferase